MKRRLGRRGGVLAALLISILVVVVLAAAALLFTGIYVARNIHVEKVPGERGETVKIETPVGDLRVAERGALDPQRLGIPVYPGASAATESGHGADLAFDFGDEHKELRIVAAKFSTTDSVEKVVEYYRQQLPHWVVVRSHRGQVRITSTEDNHKRIIVVRERQGRTEIALASVGEPGVN